MAAAPTMSYVQYFIPMDGDSEEHPNVYAIRKPPPKLVLADIVASFPLPGVYLFRAKVASGKTHVWMDLMDPEESVPSFATKFVLKVSRLSLGVAGGGGATSAAASPVGAAAPPPVHAPATNALAGGSSAAAAAAQHQQMGGAVAAAPRPSAAPAAAPVSRPGAAPTEDLLGVFDNAPASGSGGGGAMGAARPAAAHGAGAARGGASSMGGGLMGGSGLSEVSMGSSRAAAPVAVPVAAPAGAAAVDPFASRPQPQPQQRAVDPFAMGGGAKAAPPPAAKSASIFSEDIFSM